uniref:Kelch-like protein diablo n=1 Tax=Glossina pallidipes TaxID=7398 RepID=A0A1B0A4I8_GLOPL
MAAKIVNQVDRISPRKCRNSDYGNTYLNGLTKMRINQKFFDLSLDVDGEVIHVHKLALAVASDYFAAMFEADMKERKKGTVKLQNVEVDAVKTMLDYIYSGIITLTEENVEAVLSVSEIFQIAWVKEECIKFLKSNLNGENWFRVRKLADMHSCKELQNISHKYILNHLDDLITEEQLLLLSFEEMKELIKDEQRLSKSEDSAYKAAISWVKHNLEKRRVHLAELMSHIRLPLVSTEFLTNHIVAEPLLTEDQKCYKFVMEALTYQLKESSHQLTKVAQLREKCQTGTKHCNESFHVFLLGGIRDHRTGIKKCKVYDISKKKLVSISSMNEDRRSNAAASLNGLIYSVGGCNNGVLNTAECYDPVSKRWSYIAPMNNGRSSFGICTYNDLIYVVDYARVESYDPAINKWHLCQSTPIRNAELHRTTVAENSIYSLVRPFVGINELHRFDPRAGKWSDLRKMKPDGYLPSDIYELVSYDRTLFAIGPNDCKKCDLRMCIWQDMPHMSTKRHGFSAVIAAKDIYVFGGNIGFNTQVASVERFNIHNNKWTTVDSIGIEHRCGGAAVLSGDFDFN